MNRKIEDKTDFRRNSDKEVQGSIVKGSIGLGFDRFLRIR